MIGRVIGPYQVLSLLGAGGMGEVYLARDTRLGRQVALKLLPAALTKDDERLRRFELEARAASALNHPGIVTIYEIGRDGDVPFIATEFVEGQTLRERMQSGSVPLEEALDVAAQVAGALAAAHAAGVIHRDIKPENIMWRADRFAKVLDFGLAKLVEEPIGGDDPSTRTRRPANTQTGTVLGTTAYMSPEQARGLPVDARTDLFSLGIVLYELVAGRPPFEGRTPSDVLAGILERQPPPLARYAPDAPPELERIVSKALQKNPGERYQSARDLQLDLKALSRSATHISGAAAPIGQSQPGRHRGVLLATIAGLLVAATTAAVYVATRSPAPIDSIAVLPFENVSRNPETEYLSDGISNSVIERLREIPSLRISSFNAVLRYRGKVFDPVQVGREQHVRAILTGRMITVGDELRVFVELVDAANSSRLWGTEYPSRKLANASQVQEAIAGDIAANLGLRLTGEQRARLARHDTENAEAFQFYVKGRYFWNRYTEDGLKKAIGFFAQATELDRHYALAYAGLADSYTLLGDLGFSAPKEVMPQARVYAQKALELDPALAPPHASLAIVKLFYEWDWDGARRELDAARTIQPNYPDTYHFYGHYYQMIGRTADGVAATEEAVRRDPTSLIINAEYAWALCLAGRSEDAVAQARKTLDLDSTFYYATWVIAQAHEQQGRYADALAELDRVREPSGNWSFILEDLGYASAKAGQSARAREILDGLKQRVDTEFVDAFIIAAIYAGLDDRDQTFLWLDKAREQRSGSLPWLKVDTHFAPLRSDPRFGAALQRMGLPY